MSLSSPCVIHPSSVLIIIPSTRLMHKNFLAFGAGSRKCLGQNIALWLGQKLVVQVSKLSYPAVFPPCPTPAFLI